MSCKIALIYNRGSQISLGERCYDLLKNVENILIDQKLEVSELMN